jgi:hypothetical protein
VLHSYDRTVAGVVAFSVAREKVVLVMCTVEMTMELFEGTVSVGAGRVEGRLICRFINTSSCPGTRPMVVVGRAVGTGRLPRPKGQAMVVVAVTVLP